MRKTFLKIPRRFVTDPAFQDLPGGAYRLYLYMVDLVNFQTGKVTGWQDTLAAEDLGCHRGTVSRQREHLARLGLIHCDRKQNGFTIHILDWEAPPKRNRGEGEPVQVEGAHTGIAKTPAREELTTAEEPKVEEQDPQEEPMQEDADRLPGEEIEMAYGMDNEKDHGKAHDKTYGKTHGKEDGKMDEMPVGKLQNCGILIKESENQNPDIRVREKKKRQKNQTKGLRPPLPPPPPRTHATTDMDSFLEKTTANPLMGIYLEVTGGILPAAETQTAVLLALKQLGALGRDRAELLGYLRPFWESWTQRKRANGRTYARTNPAWLTDWALFGQVPAEEAPEKPEEPQESRRDFYGKGILGYRG